MPLKLKVGNLLLITEICSREKEIITGRDYVDPLGGEKLKDGLIRARRIEVKEAYKLYGKS